MRPALRHADGSFWIFGYGSLIWRPDLPYVEQAAAQLHGWVRRFWQGSHDHRGTDSAPGRVATLLRAAGDACMGMAFRIAPDAAGTVLAQLDHREKNGYERHEVTLELHDGRSAEALVYLATPGNFAWLGSAPVDEMAAQIAGARGQSGANSDYLFELERALEALNAHDPHVQALAAATRRHGAGDILSEP